MERLNGRHRASVFHCAVFLGFISAALFVATTPASAASPVTIGGPFSLVAPDGTVVTDSDFHGKWMLVFFGYTNCPDTCPTTLSQMAIALDRLGAEGKRVQPVFITVDPERDTPSAMGEYTRAIDPRIMGLSGSERQIAAVSREYGAYGEPRASGHGDHLFDHSTYIYVMNPRGEFARGLEADASGDQIADTLRRLMAQAE
ncbi:SCO family protein [Sinorhizobium garamanticum]|uniref:SCO family protein n=1 Tax=Sinorhizobium garamanticum TaxID=680247 RepID=A0ABY8DGJ7_9HYPH|nr:SCO family protein [Sinorhizobium garamanticum]WEX90009.1 SCO family protein [Sinorhizobium garamanticum]